MAVVLSLLGWAMFLVYFCLTTKSSTRYKYITHNKIILANIFITRSGESRLSIYALPHWCYLFLNAAFYTAATADLTLNGKWKCIVHIIV